MPLPLDTRELLANWWTKKEKVIIMLYEIEER